MSFTHPGTGERINDLVLIGNDEGTQIDLFDVTGSIAGKDYNGWIDEKPAGYNALWPYEWELRAYQGGVRMNGGTNSTGRLLNAYKRIHLVE